MSETVAATLNAHPEIVAVAVLVSGALLAHFARLWCARVLTLIDQRMAQHATTSHSSLSPNFVERFSRGLFWLLVLLSVIAALRILGVGGFSVLIQEIVVYVPRVVVALAVVGAGHLVGLVCRSLLSRLGPALPADSPVPRLVHASVVLVALIMAMQQLGFDITFITQLLLVLLAISTGGLVLAFALGARQHVANLIGRSELGRYAVGDRIRVDGREGEIVDIHRTGVDLATVEGRLTIPASRFSEHSVLRLKDHADGG
ncbi:MAG TPA: hypothetical protein VIS76_09425 [Pseudomonadales bacterium]